MSLARFRRVPTSLWNTPDPKLRLASPVLQALLHYWLNKRKEDRLPSRDDIDPIEMRDWLPYLFLVEIEQVPTRYRWRLVGTHITLTLGRDSTGRYFDELYEGPTLDRMKETFGRAVKAHSPMRFEGRAAFVDKEHIEYESLHLPLARADGTINMILGGLVFSTEPSMLAPRLLAPVPL